MNWIFFILGGYFVSTFVSILERYNIPPSNDMEVRP